MQRFGPIGEDFWFRIRHTDKQFDPKIRHQFQQSISGGASGVHASKLDQRDDMQRVGQAEFRVELDGFAAAAAASSKRLSGR